MTLDQRLADVIGYVRGLDARGLEAMTVAEVRTAVAQLTQFQGPLVEMASVCDHLVSDVQGLHVRVYRPHGLRKPAGTVLFFHGGGWTGGGIEFADRPVRMLAAASGAVWVSASYRLAPEHQYPASLDDAWLALAWVHQQIVDLGGDPQRLVLAGESSGANLCAGLALRARDQSGPLLAHQYLLFPALGVDFNTESYQANGDGLLLTRAAMQRFWANYIGTDFLTAPPYAAPLNAANVAGVAPATIVVAEHDALRDDGVSYAVRLREAGVHVDLVEWFGMTHGAFQMAGAVPKAAQLMSELGSLMRDPGATGRVRAVLL